MSLLNNMLGNSYKNSAINPLQLLNLFSKGLNSSDIILNLLRQNNPEQIAQIESMIQGKSRYEINNLIQQLSQQKGVDLNNLINMFKK